MEYKMMIKVLLYAAVSVANVSSTFGAYLKKYQKKALRRIKLDAKVLDTLIEAPTLNHKAYNLNVMDVDWKAEVVYIDSPYNSRRYDKNYFVLEAIAKYDNAPVTGKTGILTQTSPSNSLFCSKMSVEHSFMELLKKIQCKYIFISYSTESLLDKSKLISLMELAGFTNIKVKETLHKRFKSHTNVRPDKQEVTEFLFCGTKTDFT
jgi:adenine-specific DNA-methyltransferase